MVVTDYSSIAFEAAHFNRPVVYYQFDTVEASSGQHVFTKGYFDYERDGFGAVCQTSDAAISAIEAALAGAEPVDDQRRRQTPSPSATAVIASASTTPSSTCWGNVRCRFRRLPHVPHRGPTPQLRRSACDAARTRLSSPGCCVTTRNLPSDGHHCWDRLRDREDPTRRARTAARRGADELAEARCRPDFRAHGGGGACLWRDHGRRRATGPPHVTARRHDRGNCQGERGTAAHLGRGMPELLLDVALVDLSRGSQSGAQGVAGELAARSTSERSPRTPAARTARDTRCQIEQVASVRLWPWWVALHDASLKRAGGRAEKAMRIDPREHVALLITIATSVRLPV